MEIYAISTLFTTVFIVMVILSQSPTIRSGAPAHGSEPMGFHPLQLDIATVVSLLTSFRSFKGWTEYLTKFLPFLVRIHLSRVPIVE